MRIQLFFTFFLFSTALSAGFYKWVDSNGVAHYTDRPVEQAEELRVPGTPIRPAKPDAEETPESGASAETEQAPGEYTLFEILEPEQDQTIRNDEGEVRVGMLLQPALQEGHKLSLSVDGTPLQQNNFSTQLMLRDVPRGSHSLEASVVDEEGQPVITAPTVSFHMRKAALSKAESPESPEAETFEDEP